MPKQYDMTHKMLVANTSGEAALISGFLEEFHYEYEYCELGVEINNNTDLGIETTYPKGVVFAVLKNNNIKDSNKVIFLISKDDLDSDLFKREIALFEKERNLKFAHTQHNVSIGHSKANKKSSGRNQKHTSKSVGEKWVISR